MNPSKQIILLFLALIVVVALLFTYNRNWVNLRRDSDNDRGRPKKLLLLDKPHIYSLDDFTQNAQQFPTISSSCVDTKGVLVRI